MKFIEYGLRYCGWKSNHERVWIFYLFGWKLYILLDKPDKYELDYNYKRGSWKVK